MKSKSLLLIGTLAVTGALTGIASAKSYDIILNLPTMAGKLQLPAGEYSLKVKGNSAIFTNKETGKSMETTVKVQDSGKKFEQTAVNSSKQNGSDQITKIELGGSRTELDLGE